MGQTQPLGKLQQRIESRIATLTKKERRISAFLLEHHRDVALLSIHDLADRLNVGRATIVRLAKKLGYRAFSSLKTELKAALQNGLGPLDRFEVDLHKRADGQIELHKIARLEIGNIKTTLELLDEKSFRKAVTMISRTKDIFIFGMGISHSAAQITAYLLKRIGLRAIALSESGLKFTEQLISMNSGDLLIVFSLPPYSRETIEGAIFARKQGAKIIAFTNQAAAPIIQHSDLHLIAKTESVYFSNSLSALLVLVESLSTEVAGRNRKRAMAAIKKVISLRKSAGIA